MNVPFNFDRIRNIEFFVCIDTREGERCWQVPVDAHVQETLREMLAGTVVQLQLQGDDIPLFEPAEKYAVIEPAVVPIEQPYINKIRAMYYADHFDTNANALQETNRLAF